MHSGKIRRFFIGKLEKFQCSFPADKAAELGIELLYPPPYSTNLKLIERLWRWVKKEVLHGAHYDKFETFRNSIGACVAELGIRFKVNMQTLMTLKFQLFSEKTENPTV